MVLNVDGTSGELDPDGKPQYFTWSGAEKTYADFELTVTSPGGHSSRPGRRVQGLGLPSPMLAPAKDTDVGLIKPTAVDVA